MSLVAALLVGSIGALIGAVGLGGFMLVPVLMYFEGVSVREAIVVAALSFLVSGFVALAIHRMPGFELRGHRSFLASAAPGAIIGAIVVDAIDERVLAVVVALAFACAAVAEWLGIPRDGRARVVSGKQAVGIGTMTGFASALTGTSGPMVAMPLLAVAGVPIRARVLLGQLAQIPIAVGATLAFLSLGEIPWRLTVWAAAVLGAGVAAGALFTTRVSARWLRRIAAVLMLGAATAILFKLDG
ncbi:MAG: sulfite exporter TauE/SafE family protein [Burkholderiales bacterium]|nr:sulfite exporter TauE/SafE family protein [Burkholderiales bacterium]